jgi:hypothetical protein
VELAFYIFQWLSVIPRAGSYSVPTSQIFGSVQHPHHVSDPSQSVLQFLVLQLLPRDFFKAACSQPESTQKNFLGTKGIKIQEIFWMKKIQMSTMYIKKKPKIG